MSTLESVFSPFRRDITGIDQRITTPFGAQPLVYADWTASGRLFGPIERRLLERVGPLVGNTHSESSATGTLMTHAYHLAHAIIKEHVHAGPRDVIITAGSGMTGVVNKLIRMLGLRHPGADPAVLPVPARAASGRLRDAHGAPLEPDVLDRDHRRCGGRPARRATGWSILGRLRELLARLRGSVAEDRRVHGLFERHRHLHAVPRARARDARGARILLRGLRRLRAVRVDRHASAGSAGTAGRDLLLAAQVPGRSGHARGARVRLRSSITTECRISPAAAP